MSAVGLMLLEDPKARARAEARIRNGTAKRRSFFGRSSGAAPAPPPPGAARRLPNLPPTIPDEDGEDESPIVRPSTSLSQTIALPGRKKNDSTSDRSSSRNSTIFGRKNSVSESSIKSGSSGRASQLSGVGSSHSREKPRDEEDYRPQMRKPAALPPSQSQHPSQATKAASQPLEVVDENDMQAKFWAKSKYAKPNLQLNGIKAEDWDTTQPIGENDRGSTSSPALPPVDPNPPRIPAAARMSFFDDTIFNDVQENSFNSNDSSQIPPIPGAGARPRIDPIEASQVQEWSRHTSRGPKQYSTMVARNSLMFPEEPILQTPGSSCEDDPLASSGQDELHLSQRTAGVSSGKAESLEAMPKTHTTKPVVRDSQAPVHQPRQASLPVRERKAAPKSSESSLGYSSSNSNSSQSLARLDVPVKRTVDVAPASPSRLSDSTGKSPALSFSSNVRESTVFDDSTWEDDIDFAYEEGADATCDFDWDSRNRNHVNSVLSDGGVRLSAYNADRTPSLYSNGSRDSRIQDNSPRESRALNNGTPTTERRESQNAAEHARGSSVGHRGFAAARNSTGDKLAKSGKLSPLTIPARSSQGDALSPVDSITDSGDETPKSPLTPSKLEFPMPPGTSDSLEFPMPPNKTDRLDTLDFPMPPSSNRTRDSVSSDVDSWHSGSKHRKSSSYGSYEGFKRASTAPSTAPSSVPSSRDTGRWSMASASSVPNVPNLIPGNYKRTSSLTKANGSPPLEPLAQSPEEEKLGDRFDGVPQVLQADPERESFVMRRPRTSGDRRLLQAAGRVVQGRAHRPMTPNSSSRGPQAHETYGSRVEPSRVAPEWI